MNNQDQSSTKTTHITVGSIVSWVLGIGFIVMGLGAITSKLSLSILCFLGAVILIPPISTAIQNKLHFSLSRGIKIIIVIILLIVTGTMSSKSNPSTGQAVNNTPEENVPKTEEFSEVASFRGRGNQNTASFAITGSKVRITATTSGSSVGSYSAISLEKENGGIMFDPGLSIMTDSGEPGNGQTTYRNIKSGQYFIKVISGISWTVKVEQSN